MALYVLLGLSAAANLGLLVFCLVRWRKPPPRPAQPTLSAEDLLHDLTTRGSSVIRIEVIDAKNLYLRSPNR